MQSKHLSVKSGLSSVRGSALGSPFVKQFVRNGDSISEAVYSSYGKKPAKRYKNPKNPISRFEDENFNDRGLEDGQGSGDASNRETPSARASASGCSRSTVDFA